MNKIVSAVKNFFKYILIGFWADREAAKAKLENQTMNTSDLVKEALKKLQK